MFSDSMDRVLELAPENITVHTFCVKRSAAMRQRDGIFSLNAADAAKSVEYSQLRTKLSGYRPYYMYRQKNIAGNFENVGYAEVDKAGIYNILIMEEKQTILAAGAGASTKILLKEPIRTENGKEIGLVRIENVKNITEYISRIDEMIERKGEWLWR